MGCTDHNFIDNFIRRTQCPKRKKAQEVAAEAKNYDWMAYFESIKTVCPWSWSAVLCGAIDITHWHSQVKDLDKNKARLYLAPNHKPRQLKKICDRLNRNRPHEEWLWSHPKYGFNSTPVAVLIQQDRHTLEKARKNLSFSRFSQ